MNLLDSLILNVDDSDGTRYAKSRILTRAGFKVIEAATGEQALEMAAERSPDLILLDVKLPDINGFEVCRRLKEDDFTRTILILQTSASYVGIGDKIRALDGGADNYLFEPIEPEELVANVKALLRLGKVEKELREADRRKDLFLAMLAHELRNPLAPIRTAAELLERIDSDPSPVQSNARRTIVRQTEHMSRLVDDLLDVSRVNQGKLALKRASVSVRSFIEAAVEVARPRMDGDGHTLSIDLPDETLMVEGDAVRLCQIFGNLLHNAAKFTPSGGTIQLRAAKVDGTVRISVVDNGIGIQANDVDSIFDLFSQGDFRSGKMREGLGIGLSLVRSLVELHGGMVTVASPGAGLGSAFEVRLPLQSGQAEPVKAAAADAEPALPSRVLVVDDNIDAADMIASLLELEGHQVATRYNAREALDCAVEFQPEVVLLDIGLPDLDGYEVARQLRRLPEMEKVVLVAVTGFGRESDRDKAFAAGFNLHLVKPVTPGTLRLTVRSRVYL
jgi:signal transduction histidine kinase